MKYRHLDREEIDHLESLVNGGVFRTRELLVLMRERFDRPYSKTTIDARLKKLGVRRAARWPVEIRESFVELCKSNPDKPTRVLYRTFNELTQSGIYYDLARAWRAKAMGAA